MFEVEKEPFLRGQTRGASPLAIALRLVYTCCCSCWTCLCVGGGTEGCVFGLLVEVSRTKARRSKNSTPPSIHALPFGPGKHKAQSHRPKQLVLDFIHQLEQKNAALTG